MMTDAASIGDVCMRISQLRISTPIDAKTARIVLSLSCFLLIVLILAGRPFVHLLVLFWSVFLLGSLLFVYLLVLFWTVFLLECFFSGILLEIMKKATRVGEPESHAVGIVIESLTKGQCSR